MSIGRLLARTTIGALFIGHGTQKLFGWFEGPGLDGTTGMMDKLEMRPARHNALAALAAGVGGSAAAIELAKRTAAQEKVDATGRFQRSRDGVEQQAPVQDPA